MGARNKLKKLQSDLKAATDARDYFHSMAFGGMSTLASTGCELEADEAYEGYEISCSAFGVEPIAKDWDSDWDELHGDES